MYYTRSSAIKPLLRDAIQYLLNRKLMTTAEATLIEWILSTDQRESVPTTDIVNQMANLLLQKMSQNQANPSIVAQR